MKRIYSILLILIAVQGCAYSVHQNYISGFAPYPNLEKAKKIIVEEKEHVIFTRFFSQPTVSSQAYASLQSQCSNGRIVGISTEYRSDLGFLSWYDVIRMEGFCVQ